MSSKGLADQPGLLLSISGGIGSSVAHALASEGCDVALHYSSSQVRNKFQPREGEREREKKKKKKPAWYLNPWS